MTSVTTLARMAGIAVAWRDACGKRHAVSRPTLLAVLSALGYPAGSDAEIKDSAARLAGQPQGQRLCVIRQGACFKMRGRRLELIGEDGAPHTLAIRGGQARADLPPGYYRTDANHRIAIVPRRAFQPQSRGWGVAVQIYALRGSPGIGDFGALAAFCEDAALAGADAVMISPVHALADGGVSPYTPDSRRHLNPLYIPVPGRDQGNALIDWPHVSRRRMAALRRDFERFQGDGAFDAFVRQNGQTLAGRRPQTGPDARFQFYLQWRADCALAQAQARARAAGMRIGLITDVAIGLDPRGSEAAANPGQVLQGLSVGAPPDAFNRDGQDWGLTALSPSGLAANGYDGFIRTLRAAMRHAGGIRLDHAMGLMRLWVIPHGHRPRDGAYLHYPFQDLLGLLCLESRRHDVLVIAEDLGTVPPSFRRAIRRAGLLGMEVLWFSRSADAFRPPRDWPGDRVALSTTHDLPTLAGWWRGRDLDWQDRIAGKPHADARRRRSRDRRALWKAIGAGPCPSPDQTAAFTDQAIAALAQGNAPLTLVCVEDLVGEIEQPNIPGTIDQHPNWRRRLKAKRPMATRQARRRAALLNRKAP
jgi:4-alpha-glucanotransferase